MKHLSKRVTHPSASNRRLHWGSEHLLLLLRQAVLRSVALLCGLWSPVMRAVAQVRPWKPSCRTNAFCSLSQRGGECSGVALSLRTGILSPIIQTCLANSVRIRWAVAAGSVLHLEYTKFATTDFVHVIKSLYIHIHMYICVYIFIYIWMIYSLYSD